MHIGGSLNHLNFNTLDDIPSPTFAAIMHLEHTDATNQRSAALNDALRPGEWLLAVEEGAS